MPITESGNCKALADWTSMRVTDNREGCRRRRARTRSVLDITLPDWLTDLFVEGLGLVIHAAVGCSVSAAERPSVAAQHPAQHRGHHQVHREVAAHLRILH